MTILMILLVVALWLYINYQLTMKVYRKFLDKSRCPQCGGVFLREPVGFITSGLFTEKCTICGLSRYHGRLKT